MKRPLLIALLSGAMALPAAAALRKGPVVVYFYPSAYTQGCNIEAHEFPVNADKFAAAGTTI